MSGRGHRGGHMEPRRPYKVLCVSSLHPKASDDVVRDTLYREFKKYGDISVRVVLDPDGRVAYVYFRNFDDARDARHSKSRIILFDKPAVVEPVYESRSETSSSGNYNHSSNSSSRRQQQRSVSPPPYSSSRYRSRSPPEYSSSSSRYRDNYRDDYHSSSRDYHREPSHRSHSSRDYESHERGRGRGSSHHHGDDHRGGGGHRGGRGGYQGSRPNKYDRDNKKDKFPNYLDHIQPEDDPLATRTLFTGNLELNITEEEIRRIFGRYGNLLDVDIKRPPPGTGNAYAFIRYENLDMSHRAKVELSGQYIGKFQCKIGYGKVHATTKVWVGGLGCWCSPSLLWKEFDRFGAIKEVEYREGDSQAHVQYENIDAAQAAVQEMRGHPLGGPDKRLRIDFADLDVVPSTRRDLDNYDKSSTNGRSRAGGRGSGGDRGAGGRGARGPPSRPSSRGRPSCGAACGAWAGRRSGATRQAHVQVDERAQPRAQRRRGLVHQARDGRLLGRGGLGPRPRGGRARGALLRRGGPEGVGRAAGGPAAAHPALARGPREALLPGANADDALGLALPGRGAGVELGRRGRGGRDAQGRGAPRGLGRARERGRQGRDRGRARGGAACVHRAREKES